MVFFGGDGGSFFLFHLMSNGIGFGLLKANEPIEKKDSFGLVEPNYDCH